MPTEAHHHCLSLLLHIRYVSVCGARACSSTVAGCVFTQAPKPGTSGDLRPNTFRFHQITIRYPHIQNNGDRRSTSFYIYFVFSVVHCHRRVLCTQSKILKQHCCFAVCLHKKKRSKKEHWSSEIICHNQPEESRWLYCTHDLFIQLHFIRCRSARTRRHCHIVIAAYADVATSKGGRNLYIYVYQSKNTNAILSTSTVFMQLSAHNADPQYP